VFLILSKLLDLLVAPLSWAILLGLLALRWQRQKPGKARLALLLGLLQLTAFSVDPVARWLFGRLERRAQDTFQPEPPYDVVVVLGGMVDGAAMQRSGQLELNDAVDRISRAAILVRTGQARQVLISGGLAFPLPGEVPEAELLAGWLRDQGIPADRIVVEPRSRNTRENALESAALVAKHGWKRVLLVTSAWHAPRALGCFRAVGLAPDLLGVDHRSGRTVRMLWLPRAEALSTSTDALRELLGNVVYWLMGYTR
jgi:uncharacterized SAM-binding protein YcdF (DUF218 family)